MNQSHFIVILVTVFLIFFLFPGHTVSQTVIINEVMASNRDYLADDDGEFSDWIELYNYGTESVSLAGWGLSDSSGNPFKWVFPDIELQPGAYLLVWASGKDRSPLEGDLRNGIKRRFYPDIPGTSVNDLINHPSFPDFPATRNVINGVFEAPVNVADNYGQHLFTWILPPQTGNYVFGISSDDSSRLYLSTSESEEDVQLIASVTGWTNSREWSKFESQTSAPVYLEAGQMYYLSARMKEGAGGDHLAVRWIMSNGTTEAPMSTEHCYIPATGLHTNFSISATGEEIFLTAPDSTLIDMMPAVLIPANRTFGRLPGDTVNWVYFADPTPAETNSDEGFAEINPTPWFSLKGGLYRHPVQVSISSDDPDAVIYYTTNGSFPSPSNGYLYSNTLTVSGTTLLRAAAYDPDKLPSEVVGEMFSVQASGLHSFSSDLPVMVIQSPFHEITPGDRTPAYVSLYEPGIEGRTSFENDPTFTGRILINIRGSSSQNFLKQGYGFHTIHEDDSNRKIELLGLPEEHNWVLHGPYSDKSLMRNALSYAIGEDMGHYSPRTRFIELYLHSDTSQISTSHYHGVYVLTERIKIAPGRVDIAELDMHDNAYPEVSGGYIFKIDRLNPGERGFRTAMDSHYGFVRPNEETITASQRYYLVSYLDSLETALFSQEFASTTNGYRAFLDTRSFIDMHLVTELLKEIDGFRLSTFFYKDRQEKLIAGPLWDFNLSIGNADYNDGFNPTGWYYTRLPRHEYLRGWYTRLFQDPQFAREYNRRYRLLRLTAFSHMNIFGRIDENVETLQEAQQRNFERWSILGHRIWPNWYVGSTWDDEITWMSNWLRQRLNWMDSQLGQPLTMIHYWNFNEEDHLSPSYSINDGVLQADHAPDGEIITDNGQDFRSLNGRNGDAPGNHLRINNPVGSELRFNLSTVGYRNVMFSYETRRSANGANRQFVSYTADGAIWIPVDTIRVNDKTETVHIDFESFDDANDNALFAIKIEFGFDDMESIENRGNNRIDNVSLAGEPHSGVVRPPVQIKKLPEYIELIAGPTAETFDLTQYFYHPDGHTVQYNILGNGQKHIDVLFNGSLMSITPNTQGGELLSLEITDGINPPLYSEMYILVYPAPVVLSQNPFLFDSWSRHAPEGSFPPHLLFMQSEQDDPGLHASFRYPYHIPADDYASGDAGNIGFPYRNESRTRINSLEDHGISFINTGRGRDLGTAVMAIDTRNLKTFNFSWEGGTVRANSREYAIRLQYRTSLSDMWRDYTDQHGNVVEYRRSDVAGHSHIFEELPLPDDATDEPFVQLRWLYYFTGERVSESSGARDMLAIHFISISQSEYVSVDRWGTGPEGLKLYPNPVTGDRIWLSRPATGFVMDLHGRNLLFINNADHIDTSGFAPGVYIFTDLKGGRGKFVVVR